MAVQSRIYQHLRCLGYPDVSSAAFAARVSRWVAKSGTEWTCRRLKDLKQALKDRLQDGYYSVPVGWATRKGRHGRVIFADSFVHRALSVDLALEDNLRKVEGLIRVYTVLKNDDVTETQKTKMYAAITGAPLVDLGDLMKSQGVKLTELRGVSRRFAEHTNLRGDDEPPLHMMLQCTETKSSPVISFDGGGHYHVGHSAKRNTAESADWEEYFQTDVAANSLWKQFPNEIARRIFGTTRYPYSYSSKMSQESPCGTLSVIQEAGCKARWVANPLLCFQALGQPLKWKLQEYSWSLYPEIGTKDQDAAREQVVEWLRNGEKIWSFDSSSFTDRFPLVLQMRVLHQLQTMGVINEFDVKAFELIMSKPWFWQTTGELLKWEVGQPLGYGPSFALACLTHAAILDNLDVKQTGKWMVVGDDVVIADADLALEYQAFMQGAGVEINLSKTLVSDEYAEFLGKLITSFGVNPAMKVRLITGHDQLIDNVAFYGKSALPFLTDLEREWVRTAYLPEELGGLGWRIDDVPYSSFLEVTNQGVWSQAKMQKDLRAFCGLSLGPQTEQTEAHMNTRAKWFSRNVAPLSAAEWQQLGFGETLDGFTGLPTSSYPVADVLASEGQLHRTFMDLVDIDASLTGKSCSTRQYFNKYGHISEYEKPFNGQSSTYRSSSDDKSNKTIRNRDRSSLVFSKRRLARLARSCEGRNREEIQLLLTDVHPIKESPERNSHDSV